MLYNIITNAMAVGKQKQDTLNFYSIKYVGVLLNNLYFNVEEYLMMVIDYC